MSIYLKLAELFEKELSGTDVLSRRERRDLVELLKRLGLDMNSLSRNYGPSGTDFSRIIKNTAISTTVKEGPGIDVVDGEQVGVGWDTILVVRGDGRPAVEYAATTTGVKEALRAANSGDVVWLPTGSIALTSGITVPSGVTLLGMGENTILNITNVATGISLGAGSTLANLKCSVVGTGTDIIGVNSTVHGARIRHVTITTSGGSVSNVGVLLGDATLSAFGSSTGVTHTVPGSWSVVTGTNEWHGAGFRLQSGTALGDGNLEVTIEIDSVPTPPNDGLGLSGSDQTTNGVSPEITPTLTGNVGTVDISAGGTFVLTGTLTPFSTDGYFCIISGWATSGAYTARITKIAWLLQAGGRITLWEGSSITGAGAILDSDITATGTAASAVKVASGADGYVYRSILAGDTYDLNNAGDLLGISGNKYDHAKTNGTLTHLMGDRASWNIAANAARHASDINSGSMLRHLPAAGTTGNIAQDDGTNWVSTAPPGATISVFAAAWSWMGF
jgi:hypothetical protein